MLRLTFKLIPEVPMTLQSEKRRTLTNVRNDKLETETQSLNVPWFILVNV